MPKKSKPKSKPKQRARKKPLTIVSRTREAPQPQNESSIGQGLHAISKATDALVKRVEHSALSQHPAESVLDQARDFYSEESRNQSINIQCDRCKLKSPGCASLKKAIEVASELGWEVTDTYDYCPLHRTDSKLLTPGSIALIAPPVLSIRDQILVTRLEFLCRQFQEGTSAEALIQNSISSGRRSMLSDFAEGFRYDASLLVQTIDALRARHAAIDPSFDGVPIRQWLKEVLRLVEQIDALTRGEIS